MSLLRIFLAVLLMGSVASAEAAAPPVPEETTGDTQRTRLCFCGSEATLFGWNPWSYCSTRPKFAALLRRTMRHPLLGQLWDGRTVWGHHLVLESWMRGKRLESKCDDLTNSRASDSSFSVRHRIGWASIEIAWKSRTTLGGQVPAIPTRQFEVERIVKGKKVKCWCVEASAELPISREERSLEIIIGPGKLFRWKDEWTSEQKCKMTVRHCRGNRWHSGQVKMGKREAGPGWIEIPEKKEGVRLEECLAWTEWNETFLFKAGPWWW